MTARDGWFVAGKFDAYRRDQEADALHQAFRALGRLLLAEPEEELAQVRGQILAATGPNAGLPATLPEFAALLGVPPDPGDPLTVQVRGQRVTAQVLRAVASQKRPVLLFADDLQWAGRKPLEAIDQVLGEEPTEGLLLVGTYRDDEVDAAHPLAGPLSRWQGRAGVRHLRLANLAPLDLVTMIAEMLHADPAAAAGLAGLIGPHTSGNPYETVEVLNALRRDGVLTAAAGGWRWDTAVVRAHLGGADVAGLLATRVGALPAASRQLVEAMACLGGRTELSVLQAAAGAPAGVVDQVLAPAFAEGLLVAEPGPPAAVRFRHDRTREVVLDGLDSRGRRAVQLAMARRLAAVPELFMAAADQYLPVADAVDDPAERRLAAGLLRSAAAQTTLTGEYALANALLAAALPLIDPSETAMLAEVHAARHAALYTLGRLEDADEEYRAIEDLIPAALERADATAVQVRSLTHRSRFADAVGLGLESLRELGITVPAAGRLSADLDRQFGYLYRWLRTDDELARPEITDSTLLAATRLVNAVLPAVYPAAGPATVAWLGLEALRIWIEHGPAPALVGAVSHTSFAALALRGDYATGYRVLRRIVAAGETRGYEPGTSQARFLFAARSCWFEPIENGVQAAQRAREGRPSSAIRPGWRSTPRRRCRCCRPSWTSTRTPWPACCAG